MFQLAADHGGRGYIATHPADCVTNMALDSIVFEAAVDAGVEKLTFASSVRVYPTDIQWEPRRLQENMVSFEGVAGHTPMSPMARRN